MNNRHTGLGVGIALLVFLLGGCANAAQITLSGTIEYTEYDINSEASGKVLQTQKAEGDAVQEGEVVASVDSSLQQTSVAQMQAVVDAKQTRLEELKAGSRRELVAQAEAALKAAKANYNAVKKGSSADQLSQAQAALDTAIANEQTAKIAYDYAKQKYDDAAIAFGGGMITQSDLNDAKYAMDTAYGKYQAAIQQHALYAAQLAAAQNGASSEAIEAAQAAVDQAQANLNLLKNGSTQYVIQEAQSDLDAANAQLAQAKLLLSRCDIKAPATGILNILNITKGDMVNTGGFVATILDANDAWLYVYIPQSKLRYVTVGQQVQLKTSAYPGESFTGIVLYVANEAEFTPKNIQTNEAKENTVFRVKIKLLDSAHKLKAGMTMDAVIPLR